MEILENAEYNYFKIRNKENAMKEIKTVFDWEDEFETIENVYANIYIIYRARTL